MTTDLLHPVMTNVASNLKTLFAHAGVTQVQVGEWLGISDGQVSRLLRPKSTGQAWTLPQLGRIADYFGVTPAAFLGTTREMFDQLPPKESWHLPEPTPTPPAKRRGLPRPDSNREPAGYAPRPKSGYSASLHGTGKFHTCKLQAA